MNLKIFVTHTSNKNDEVVNNPLFVDVIAGAVNQIKPMPENFVGDNTGIHISEKNKCYCELSTQYWAWKNVDADYYGFCHYRRYMTLSEKRFDQFGEMTDRGQINAQILSPYTAELFGLTDSKSMEAFVEKYDCILPTKQNLSKLLTPIGKQKDVYGHFAGHDRMFMHAPDLDILMQIIDELYPAFSADAHKFMKQSSFWGFNCFVLRKDLFHELCEFEFSILEELEKRIDDRLYNRQMSRIYGFMAEILSCLFFYHLQKNRPELRYGETQLVYFEYPEKKKQLETVDDNTINVLFNTEEFIEPYRFLIAFQTFLNAMNSQSQYRVILCHYDMDAQYLNYYKSIFQKYDNITFFDYNYNNINRELSDAHLKCADARLLLPWIFSNLSKVLYIDGNALISESIDSIYNTDLDNHLFAAPYDALATGRVYEIDSSYEKALRANLKINKDGLMYSTSVCLLNLELIRKSFKKEIFYLNEAPKINHSYNELFNSYYGENGKILSMQMGYYYTEHDWEKKTINQCPLFIADEYAKVKNPIITIYNWDVPNLKNATDFSLKYWKLAEQSDLYPYFISGNGFVVASGNKSYIMQKTDGWFKCIQDHGLLYTLGYTLKKCVKSLLK